MVKSPTPYRCATTPPSRDVAYRRGVDKTLFLVYTSVTPIATAMALLYRFYCIFVYHVLIILDLYFASWVAVRA